MKFTLVSTVYNEAKRLEQTIRDLENQTVKPSEIIITDAGSTDGTYERLLAWSQQWQVAIKILQKRRCNVAQGRNLAIQQAAHNLIVSMDFGCRFHKDWLKSIVHPFSNSNVCLAGTNYGVIEDEIVTLPAKAAFVIYGGYVQTIDKKFIPSSRSIAYYKEVYYDVGGYCEWLTLAADDTVFGKLLQVKGYKAYIEPRPLVYWGRHKHSSGYAKESFRYGLGDGEARISKRIIISTCIEMGLRYISLLLVLFGWLVFTSYTTIWYLLFIILLAAGLRSHVRYAKNWIHFRTKKYDLKVFFYGFYLMDVLKLNYLHGYYRGYFKSSEQVKENARKLGRQLNILP